MPAKKKQGDFRNLFIVILVFIVAVESYVLLIHRKGSQPVAHKTIQQPKKTLASASAPQRPAVKPVELEIAEPPSAHTPSPAVRPVVAPLPLKHPSGEGSLIAIIIDDWGYNASHCEYLAQIKEPVDVAVLPHLAHSEDIANCAYEHNKEVMLHFPMEPHWNEDEYPKDYIVRTTMPAKKVLEILDESLKSVPHAVGVNNHMGSKATEDQRLMSIIYDSLKKRGLFFVDSLVTSESICQELAKEKGIAFARRDIFLDNQNDRHYIEKQFERLALESRKKGYAIGIGHDRVLTLEIIKEETALLSQQGFKIVTIQELLKHL